MKHVQSTCIASVGYDARRAELHIQFVDSKDTYIYIGVPEDLYHALLNAPSKGTFFSLHIRPVYKQFRVL